MHMNKNKKKNVCHLSSAVLFAFILLSIGIITADQNVRADERSRLEAQQKAAADRENKQFADMKAKAAAFVPKDTRVLGMYGFGQKVAVLYQYKLEFYRLPKEFEIRGDRGHVKIFKGDKEVSITQFQPNKAMTFKYRIEVAQFAAYTNHPIWVYTNPLISYTSNSPEEHVLVELRRGDAKGEPWWVNQSAQYEYFCGVVSLDGDILYQVPIKQHTPDTLLRVLWASEDSKTALLIVGEKDVYDVGDGPENRIWRPRKLFVWNYPETLREETIKPLSIADPEMRRILGEYGIQ